MLFGSLRLEGGGGEGETRPAERKDVRNTNLHECQSLFTAQDSARRGSSGSSELCFVSHGGFQPLRLSPSAVINVVFSQADTFGVTVDAAHDAGYSFCGFAVVHISVTDKRDNMTDSSNLRVDTLRLMEKDENINTSSFTNVFSCPFTYS